MLETVKQLPLQSEAEMVCAGLDLVLGLQMIHAIRGNTINRQNDVSDTHLGSGRLASIGELQRHSETCKKNLVTDERWKSFYPTSESESAGK